jgi:dephospho-CoA kinase
VKQSARAILKIGVTGGIGSGKSLVCSFFEQHGVPVLSADLIARQISNTNEKVKKEIIRLLGPHAYEPDGTMNRSYVASRIFEKKALQKKINRLVHPLVVEAISTRFDQLARSGHRLGVVEAALIYEAGLDRMLDFVIVVEADEATRVARVVERDNITEREVRQRLDAQWKSSARVKRADFVLYNNGTPEELIRRVQFLYNLLHHLTPS